MTIERKAEAEWKGNLQNGKGEMRLGSGAYHGAYSFKERTAQSSSQTNPEELIGAALAGCFSMQLAALLSKSGHNPSRINTSAKVFFELDPQGPYISKISLETEGNVPDLTEDEFKKQVETAKTICPVSKALKGVDIQVSCKLI